MWLKLWKSVCAMHPGHLALLQKAKPYLKCYFPLRLNGENVNSWSLRFCSNWVSSLSRNSTFYWAINHLLRNFDRVCCLLQGDAQKGETGERGPGVCVKLECVSDKWTRDSVTDWLDPAVQLQNWLLLTCALDNQADRISEGELWGENVLINRVVMGPMTFPSAQLNYWGKTEMTKAPCLTSCGYFFLNDKN